MKRNLLTVAAASVASTSACGPEATQTVAPRDEVRLSLVSNWGSKDVMLAPGDTIRYSVRATNQRGETVQLAGAPVFTSRDTSRATIGTSGLVTARTVGLARIVVSLDRPGLVFTDSAAVVVATLH